MRPPTRWGKHLRLGGYLCYHLGLMAATPSLSWAWTWRSWRRSRRMQGWAMGAWDAWQVST